LRREQSEFAVRRKVLIEVGFGIVKGDAGPIKKGMHFHPGLEAK